MAAALLDVCGGKKYGRLGRFLNQLAKDRDKVRHWLDFLKAGSATRGAS